MRSEMALSAMRPAALLVPFLLVAACNDQGFPNRPVILAPDDEGRDAEATTDGATSPGDAGADTSTTPDAAPVAKCASTFGKAITAEHGRLDGVVRAVVPPDFKQKGCRADDNHLFVQIDVVEANVTATYSVAVTVVSDIAQADPMMRYLERASNGLYGPVYAPGWHPGILFDYGFVGATSSSGFAVKSKAELASLLVAAIPVGAKISAFMDGYASGDGGHKVHRNQGNNDGALVVQDGAKPRYLLFHFSTQTF